MNGKTEPAGTDPQLIMPHPNVRDLTGKTFGRWTVVGYAGKSYWRCRCDCGTERRVFTGALTGKASQSRSCGCWRDERNAREYTTHGLTRSAEYKTWAGMKRRCLNPNDRAYLKYGAAGVTVCDRWSRSFEAFLADMGKKPSPTHTIDRIDNARGYDPSNCRWATPLEQARNKRTNRVVTLDGESKTLSEWAEALGVGHETIRARLRAGWTLRRALTEPAVLGRNQFS